MFSCSSVLEHLCRCINEYLFKKFILRPLHLSCPLFFSKNDLLYHTSVHKNTQSICLSSADLQVPAAGSPNASGMSSREFSRLATSCGERGERHASVAAGRKAACVSFVPLCIFPARLLFMEN